MAKNKEVRMTFNPKKMLLSRRSPFSMQEAYKTLRTNVAFSLPGTDCKCIGIVSANRGDGKSSVAANLALSFGQIKKKVLLIDCDLRIPTLASKLEIESQPGLSNYLIGEIKTIPIQHIDGRNIDVIAAGNIPPEPTTLIESEHMFSLIEELKESYDYIIIDFPPISIVSDAALLSGLIDGYLMVVSHQNSELSKINEALRQMRFADAKMIGFVYNKKNYDKSVYKKKYYR